VHREVRGVDDARRARTERRESLSFQANAVEHGGAVVTSRVDARVQRMRAARLVEPAKERFIGRIEEEHMEVALPVALQQRKNVANGVEECAHAHVDAETDARDPSALAKRDRLQVVGAKESEILERMKRLRFAGAREAGDDDDRRARGLIVRAERHSSLSVLRRTAGIHAELSVMFARSA
jgi:hypothetical protein